MKTAASALVLVAACCLPVAAKPAQKAPSGVEVRVRCTQLEPDVPVRIHFRTGGEGLGGRVKRDELTRFPHQVETTTLQTPQDRVVVSDKSWVYHYLKLGTWSEPAPLERLPRGFVTFTVGGRKTGKLTNGVLEFEFRRGDTIIKRFTVAGPDGPTFGVFIPSSAPDSPEFIEDLGGLLEYVKRKKSRLAASLGDARTAPRQFAILTDCAGYKPGSGYGCRTANKATMIGELEILAMLGFNGLRSAPPFAAEMIRQGKGIGAAFRRTAIIHTLGYPIPRVKRADGKQPQVHQGDGCPHNPVNTAGIKGAVEAAVKELQEAADSHNVETVWALTVDEIGSIFDGAPEGKAHQGVCPYCRKAFHDMIRRDGRSPADFGGAGWEDIRSDYGYWGRSYWEVRQEREAALKTADKALRASLEAAAAPTALTDLDATAIDTLEELDPKTKPKPEDAIAKARKELNQLLDNPRAGQPKVDKRLPLSESGKKLLRYYSGRFNNESSAALFTPLRDAVAHLNAETDDRPEVYTYSLRGNTFLMGGHSLDFFDWYRAADNGFVYETSNRDPRVWHWDAYLCDVGRSLQQNLGRRFGIYVKPHRGAPVQRALAAASRGARMIFWYTYGPEWRKGDSFGGNVKLLTAVGRANQLLAGAEAVIYDATWAQPAEIALVRPLTSKLLGDSANWENGKWIHTALSHGHFGVDALDETLVMTADLSRYRAVYVSGTHLRRDVAAKLVQWVAGGGVLYTSGGGLMFDEAGEPLTELITAMGLKARTAPVRWADIARYGATRLKPFQAHAEQPPPPVRQIAGKQPISLAVGREVLQPQADAEVLARFGDGAAAIVRHQHGKGTIWTAGFYAGLEYAHDATRWEPWSPDKRDWVTAAAASVAKPVVDASVATVEGVLMKNSQSGALAVVLMNWTFTEDRETTPHTGLDIRLRETDITAARSLALDRDLKVRRDGADLVISLPSLADGDILLLSR